MPNIISSLGRRILCMFLVLLLSLSSLTVYAAEENPVISEDRAGTANLLSFSEQSLPTDGAANNLRSLFSGLPSGIDLFFDSKEYYVPETNSNAICIYVSNQSGSKIRIYSDDVIIQEDFGVYSDVELIDTDAIIDNRIVERAYVDVPAGETMMLVFKVHYIEYFYGFNPKMGSQLEYYYQYLGKDYRAISEFGELLNSSSSSNLYRTVTSSSAVTTPTSVRLNKTSSTLKKGATLSLAATVSPSSSWNKKVTWKSSNTKVATVTSSGKVKAVAPGTATITCTTQSGGRTATCKITVPKPISISAAKITKLSDKYYTGAAIKQTPVVKLGTKTLKAETDYTVAYKNNTKVGTATVTITGKGDYTGKATATFKIKALKNLSKATISTISNQLYTGKEIKPKFTVKYAGKTLKPGTDYTVKYSNNVDIGTATITITGKGIYTGTVKKTFRIEDPVEAFVTRLYKVCLDRSPDKSGLNYWVNRLRLKIEGGGSVALGFFNSKEFKNHKYGNSAFLDHAYKAFFDRKADSTGKNYWMGQLKKGMSRDDVIKGFAASNEFKALCRIYGINPRVFVLPNRYTEGTLSDYDVSNETYGQPSIELSELYYEGSTLVLKAVCLNNRRFYADYYEYITITLYDDSGSVLATKKFNNVNINLRPFDKKYITFRFPASSIKKKNVYLGLQKNIDFSYQFYYYYTIG